jgi:hypothetical protein
LRSLAQFRHGQLIAGYLLRAAGNAGPIWLLGLTLLLAMAIPLILNNVTTVTVLTTLRLPVVFRFVPGFPTSSRFSFNR